MNEHVANQAVGNIYSVSGVKYRNLFKQVILTVFTLGLYTIYWFLVTAREMQYINRDPDASPELWTILHFVPFAVLYSWYKFAQLVEEMTDERYETWLIFILWIFFSPAVWYLVQTELNRRATYNLQDRF